MIMDASGDYQLGPQEIRDGVKLILGEDVTDDELDIIMKNVDIDGNGFIDYIDFLLASVDLSTPECIIKYCHKSYELLFVNSDREQVTIQQMSDLLANNKFLNPERMRSFLV